MLKGSKAVHTLSRILSLFSPERDQVGVREASQLLRLPPANIHRIFHSMEAEGLLEKTSTHRYRIGERLFEAGILYYHNDPLRKIVRPHAEELARAFQNNFCLAIPHQKHPHLIIVIDRIQNRQLRPGGRVSLNLPVHCSALGKAIFAHFDREKQENILQEMPLTKYTARTISSARQLRAEIRRIKTEGFALDREELVEGVFCIAAPVFRDGSVAGAISLADTVDRMNDETYRKYVGPLKERALFISRQL
jgi:IclR family transcriptional regulator, KDG regulon repressor